MEDFKINMVSILSATLTDEYYSLNVIVVQENKWCENYHHGVTSHCSVFTATTWLASNYIVVSLTQRNSDWVGLVPHHTL